MRDGLLGALQEAIRCDDGIRLVYVRGVSGVGKTILIETALVNEGFGQNREAFFFDRPSDPVPATAASERKKGGASHSAPSSRFKNYLNNLILIRRTRLPLLYRIFSRDFRMEDAHLSIHQKFSFALTVSNRDGLTKAPRTQRRGNHLDVNLSHGAHRLNGTVEVDFFKKLWSGLRMSGCRHLHIGNIEYASEKEREYIFLLAQFTPEDSCLILEFGTLIADGSEYGFRRNLEALVPGESRREVRVDPFDEATARDFHRVMSQGRRLPTFDYSRSRGIPICILNEISIVDSQYFVGGRIKRWLDDEASRRALFALATISSVTEDHDTIEQVLAEVAPYAPLTSFPGVVEVDRDQIRFSHAAFLAYLETNHRLEIRSMLPDVVASLARIDRFAAHALRLGRGDGNTGDDLKDKLVDDILELFDDLAFPEIRHLFNVGAEREVDPDSIDGKMLTAIEALARIHDLDQKGCRPNRWTSLPWPIADLVAIYADYQFDHREAAVARADALLKRAQQEARRAGSDEIERYLRLAGIIHVMIGSSLVGVGRYQTARGHFHEADALALPSNARAYLRVLDGFNEGMPYQASKSPHDPPIGAHAYIAAKIAHNVIAARIELMRLEGCRQDLWETSITPLEMMGSREFTYGMNNLAVIDMIEGNYESSIEMLRYLRDKAYQAYDTCACENNVLCYSILIGNYEAGAEACARLEILFRTGDFVDPTFKMMSYSNILAFAWRFGDEELKVRALAMSAPPPEHEAGEFYDRKRAFMEMNIYDGNLTIDESAPELEQRYVYYPVVLHHWDFFIPPMDSHVLREWIIPRVVASVSPHG